MAGRAPQASGPGEVGPPSGWSPVARMSGRRPGRSLPCPARPVRGGDVRPAGRADVQRPHVRCPGVRCPGVRCIQVSGRTGLRCPRRRRRAVRAALDPGVARCGGPPRPGAAGRRAAVGHGRRGCLPASGRTGRDGSALAVPGSHEIDRSQGRRLAGVRLRCRLGPSGPTWALVQGQGAGRVAGSMGGAGAHRPRQASWAGRWRGADNGLDREVMTTLGGRWARMVPSRPAPEGPLGSVGEQPAAAERPQGVRSAVRSVLIGPLPARTVVGATGFEPVTSSVSDPTSATRPVRRIVRDREGSLESRVNAASSVRALPRSVTLLQRSCWLL
jgi:hypothetical protein